MRAVAYDQAGNVNENYSVPFTFTSDVTPPEVALTGCPRDSLPLDFLDVKPETADADLQSRDLHPDRGEHGRRATASSSRSRISSDEGETWGAWTALCADGSIPFTCNWDASTISIPPSPPGASVLVEFRAFAKDEFGNLQDPDTACISPIVEVLSDQAPWTWFTLIYTTPNPNNVQPLPGPPPVDGSLPNPYYYRDVIGPLRVPRGPAIDIWALFSPGEGLPASTIHDVIRVVFQYSLAGSGIWTPFATVTGQVNPDGQTVDLTLPVAVTLNTASLETGTYDIRVFSCDIDGNNCSPADQAPTTQFDIAKITVVEEGLRAYIQPVPPRDCEEQRPPTSVDLFAINWIHDYFIDHVLFQYSADDGATWIDIATDGASNPGSARRRRPAPRADSFYTLTGHVGFDRDRLRHDGERASSTTTTTATARRTRSSAT